jgi:hypothetical protein
MMDKKNDGGPAFPNEYAASGHNGMSLRDWFAGQVMNGFACDTYDTSLKLQPEETKEMVRKRYWETVVKTSYEIADAMLAERAK